MEANDPDSSEVMPWQDHVEGLIVGALRGMAEAQEAMNRTTGALLPPLNQMTMFEATELLAATLLEASRACDTPRSMERAAQKVGQHVLSYMKGLRKQRDEDGEPTLSKILEQAGLELHKGH